MFRSQLFLAIAMLIACAVAMPRFSTAAWAAEGRAAAQLKDIPYAGAAKGDRRRSFDLYMPPKSAAKPPLVIFIHGGFWLLSDDDYRIGAYLAQVLNRAGVAVALLRYRLAPAAPHPAQAQDVAAGVAQLIGAAQRYGYDSSRIFLAGHSAGGHLAALVALDPSYLAKHNASAKSLAGVIAFSGLYDLAPEWTVSENQRSATAKTFGTAADALRRASPVRHARADAPPFLLLGAESDLTGFLIDAKKFYDAMRRAGHERIERWIAPERDHFSLLRLGERDNEARMMLLDFLKVAPLPPEFKILVDAKRRWREPPFSTLPFWRHEKLIRSYAVDRRFVGRLTVVYSSLGYELKEWPLNDYHAIPLSDYLDALPAEKIGRGDFLISTNIRNEKQFWRRAELEAYQPVIVIGLDDEKNLFRLGVFYRALREYSWKDGAQPPMMARPLGAFIHFLKEPPPEVALQAAQFALTENSFRLVASDPLAGLKDLPKELKDVVTLRNGCVYCHFFRGLGSRSHHVSAADGAPHGGEALPLESYPPEVWRSFVFDQLTVAKKIGASPNPVPESARQELFDLVNRSRQQLEEKK